MKVIISSPFVRARIEAGVEDGLILAIIPRSSCLFGLIECLLVSSILLSKSLSPVPLGWYFACRNQNMSFAKNELLHLNLQILLCNEIFYGGQSNRMMFSILFVQVNQSKKIVVTCKRGQKVNWESGFVKINLKFIKKKGGGIKIEFLAYCQNPCSTQTQPRLHLGLI